MVGEALRWLQHAAAFGLWSLVAYGGAAGAAIVYFRARLGWFPWLGKLPAWAESLMVGGLVLASAYSFGWIAGDRSADVRRVQADLERTKAVLAEQVRQRQEWEKIAQAAQGRALALDLKREEWQRQQDEFEERLESGAIARCAPDPDELRRLRSIRIGPAAR